MDIFPQYTTLCLCTGYSFCLKWPSLFCPIHHSRFSAKATRYSGQSHKLLFWGLTHLSFLNLCSALDISQCSLLKYFFSPLDCYMSEVKDWIPSSLTPKCLTCWLACSWHVTFDITYWISIHIQLHINIGYWTGWMDVDWVRDYVNTKGLERMFETGK